MTDNIMPPQDAHPSVLDTPPEHPTNKSKLLNKVVGASLVLTAIAIGVMFYWATADTQLFDIKNDPFPTRTIREHPTAGGVVILDADLCKLHSTPSDVRTSFISTTREIFLPVSKEQSEKGCRHQEIPVLLPKDIPADKYKIKFRVTYDINPLKQGITQEFYSQEFTVDESAENPARQTQPSQ